MSPCANRLAEGVFDWKGHGADRDLYKAGLQDGRGEFIGGVAVQVTLVVLLFQIRANSRWLEVQTLQASAAGRQRISLSFLGRDADETIIKMYSEEPEALDIHDWTTAEAYFDAYLSMAQCDYLVGGRGRAFEEYREGSLTILTVSRVDSALAGLVE